MADSRARTKDVQKVGDAGGSDADGKKEKDVLHGVSLLGDDDDEDDEDDEDDDDEDSDEDSDDDDEDDEDDDDKGSKRKRKGQEVDIDKIVSRVVEALDDKIESRFDKRVNAVLKEVRGGKRKADDDEDKGRSKVQTEDKPESDVRGARIAFRDHLADNRDAGRFSSEEKEFAASIGKSLIQARALAGFTDEDEVGREVAKEVVSQITGLRKHYESRMKRTLRNKGLLVDPGTAGQGSGRGGRTPGGSGKAADFQAGQSVAERRHGSRQQA